MRQEFFEADPSFAKALEGYLAKHGYLKKHSTFMAE